MSTNHTEHYSLCQWLATDQVQRADFNQDNARIDTALKGLADRTGLVLLSSVTLTEEQVSYEFPTEELDWSQWYMIHLDVIPAAGSGDGQYVCFSSIYDKITSVAPNGTHVALCPFGRPDARLSALYWSSSCGLFRTENMTFQAIPNISVRSDEFSHRLMPGSSFIMRGVRV